MFAKDEEPNPTSPSGSESHRPPSIALRTFLEEQGLPTFGKGKTYPPSLPDRESYVVDFEGPDDPLNAQNWPVKTKLLLSAILIFDSISATFGSSIFSAAAVGVEAEFHVGKEVGTLGTSLFVLGFAFGPVMWGPLSELHGRRLPIIIASFGFGVFGIAVAVAKDLQTIMICRFFNGIFGSCPLAVVAAVFADMYNNETRGLAVATFAATVFMGPLLAPFIGGFISTSYLGWRWTMYLSAIMGFTSFGLTLLFMQETYGPIILVKKAKDLRTRTGNWGIHAKQEQMEVNFKELFVTVFARPMQILFTESIVICVTLYMAFLFGLLYLFITSYALVFQGVYGMTPGVAGLPFFGMIIGEIIAFIAIALLNPAYVRKLKANNNIPVPEWRLPIVMVGGILFSAGLFWFGWTGYKKDIHWIVPTVSGLFTGFGIFSVFLQLLNYIIDAYLMFAASAVAGNAFMRSLFGAIFPLFARYMYEGMGIQYGNTLIGGVAAALVPLPFLFYFFGKNLRARSRIAPALDLKQDKAKERRTNSEEV
ncbi:major facilitator superfamily domain-containing protein [Leptodontidium sp. 2 PMI_412]|nr:major facilitator superfamily domain-containing protein [Leptodontidium sp. MPI-SDFR-AT-0119]KAH9223970.1 major facilitator superfamily domain-containing protein [Leptodontidium sp. 2 PMI_412]